MVRLMRLILGLVMLSSVMLSSISLMSKSSTNAQTEDTLRSGLIFRANDQIYLAKLMTDNTWQVEALPKHLLFGQYDVFLITPRWMPDGRLLASGAAPNMVVDAVAPYGTYLYEVDVETATVHLLIDHSIIDEETIAYGEALVLQELSSDGNYLAVNTAFRYTTHIVDLQTGVSHNFNESGTWFMAWQEDQVFLTNLLQETAYLVDISSGEMIVDIKAKFAEFGEDALAFTAWPLGAGRWLFAYSFSKEGGQIWLYDTGTDSLTALADGYLTKLSDDQQQVAFMVPVGRLGLINLNTLEIIDFEVNFGDKDFLYYFEDGRLIYWEIRETESELVVAKLEWTGSNLIETIIYEGSLATVDIHPTGQFVTIAHTDRVETNIDFYANEGLSISLQDTLGASSVYSLANQRIPFYTEDGNWLFSGADYADGSHRNLLYNWQTGRTFDFPNDSSFKGYWYEGASPDGEWFLFAICTKDEFNLACRKDKLLAIHPISGEQITLIEGQTIYGNYHFPGDAPLQWSPLLNK